MSPLPVEWPEGFTRQQDGSLIERTTGRLAVLLTGGYELEDDARKSQMARAVRSLASPYALPVLMSKPEVVVGAPQADERPPAMSARAAADCVLPLCELMAGLHAVGFAGVRTQPPSLTIVREGKGYRALAMLPALRERYGNPEVYLPALGESFIRPITLDVYRLAWLALTLQSGRSILPLEDGWGFIAPSAPVLTGADIPTDMVALAQMLAEASGDPARWLARAGAWPRVETLVPPKRDYDAIIEQGEASLAWAFVDPLMNLWKLRNEAPLRVTWPLAAAYHQRGAQSYASGSVAAAMQDFERAVALDPIARHQTSLAVALHAGGDTSRALALLAEIFARDSERTQATEAQGTLPARAPEPLPDAWGPAPNPDNAAEMARAYEVQGWIQLQAGDATPAIADFNRAAERQPGVGIWHGLARAWLAKREYSHALEAAVRAAAAAPDDSRYRWLQVRALLGLARMVEARAVADEVVRRYPDDGGHAARYERYLGTPIPVRD